MELNNYAQINSVWVLNVKEESMTVKLKDADVRRILRFLKKLRTDLTVEFSDCNTEIISFDVYLENYVQIKIIGKQLYVSRDGVLEFLIDDENLVSGVILDIGLKKNFDDIRIVMQQINLPDRHRSKSNKRAQRIIKKFKKGGNRRY